MELWDLYDSNRTFLGKTHIRGNPLPQNAKHIVVEVWVMNSFGKVLLTLRDPKKETYPNLWEVPGGSILSGESNTEGAIRELFEETGITATASELRLLYTEERPHDFVDIFLLKKDITLKSLTLQPGETVDAKWLSLSAIHQLIKNKTLASNVAQRFLIVKNHLL